MDRDSFGWKGRFTTNKLYYFKTHCNSIFFIFTIMQNILEFKLYLVPS